MYSSSSYEKELSSNIRMNGSEYAWTGSHIALLHAKPSWALYSEYHVFADPQSNVIVFNSVNQMTSFTPLSFPVTGVSFQNGHFGLDVRTKVRGLSDFVSSKWRSAVGDSSPKKSMIRRLSEIVSGEEQEEAEENESAQPSPSETNSSEPASPEPSLLHGRRFSLSPSIGNAPRRRTSIWSHSGE
ncbi:hypothetical protein J7T55_015290 [Diaporthe amygdali]|uniref:uncharacterized protein n=1 Tax=Phomopsis amygdali TaxID=1214568 RepID=UPI0022FE40D7|nr:uncharacterized protein J7T55_015290 [Diaporthe amygdali]KAJ0120561.1 hypothetical protein J7T55_015290 [Diaporthe amygdali]